MRLLTICAATMHQGEFEQFRSFSAQSALKTVHSLDLLVLLHQGKRTGTIGTSNHDRHRSLSPAQNNNPMKIHYPPGGGRGWKKTLLLL
jgi:hypothetical protein